MKNKTRKIILILSFSIVLLTCFLVYSTPKVWDYDFWWHLATGRYIVEHGALPSDDPFSYVNNLKENQGIVNPLGMKFNLTQYWLAQVLFYEIYRPFGDAGIMILRGTLLLLTLLVVLVFLLRRKVSYLLIFPLIFCVYINGLNYIGERPVLFTILFSVVTFYILDEYRRSGSRLLYFLPPLMLLWANLHGGFILGMVLIATYLGGETLSYLLKRETADRRKLLTFYAVGLAAIAVSAVNPNGLRGFLALTPHYQDQFQAGVHEYTSPFVLYRNKVSPVNWGYIAILGLFPLVLIVRKRKLGISQAILLAGLCYMSVSALRYVIFFVNIGAMALGAVTDAALKEHSGKFDAIKSKLEPIFILLIFMSSLLFAYGYFNPKRLVFGKATRSTVAQGAADFVEKNKLKGNMFNDMAHGGYLIWRFYPGMKVFYDTRALNYTVMREYAWIEQATVSLQHKNLPKGKQPLWERLLDHYKVNLLVLRTTDAYGNIPALIFSLIKSDEWVPVFYDAVGLVFVRDNKENLEVIDKHRIAEKDLYNMLISTFSMMTMDDRQNAFRMMSLGDIFYNMGNYKDALKAYEYADKRLPGDPNIMDKVNAARNKVADDKEGKKSA